MATEYVVATLAQVPPGTIREVVAGGASYALFNVGGEIFASANSCPHMGAMISEGDLVGREVTCPWHRWEFDARTGENLSDPDWPGLRMQAVRVEGDKVILVLHERSTE